MINTLMALTAIDGISGDESRVREAIHEKIKESSREVGVDSIGNLIATGRKTGANPLRVMLAAHMDEVGFIITHIMEDGKLKFATVGGIDSRILTGQRVYIGQERIPGVIGYKSIHLQDKAQRESVVQLKNLYIDIGVKNKEQAEEQVQLGDYAAFAGDPVLFGQDRLKAKALDDRAGCVVLMELLKEKWPFEMFACFTVQEEVGLRGARLAAQRVKPDIAIVLEGTTCADLPGVKDHEKSTVLGNGPALTFIDRASIGDRGLLRHFTKTAEAEGIPYQFKQTASGGNDAGKIQGSGKGVRILSVSVPCRYIHSPVSVLDTKDLENMLVLLKKALFSLPQFIDEEE